MANSKKQYKIRCCSINIDGMSDRSKFMLNKYNKTENFDIIFAQETGTDDLSKLELLNMSAISDTNKAANRGAALYVNDKHSITHLDTISKISNHIDTCWGLVVIAKKRLIVGNVYAKPNYKLAMIEISSMLRAAEELQKKHKAAGILLTGDFNARHFSWGDKNINYNGRKLVEVIDNTKYSICTAKRATFLCKNKETIGNSYIDLNIISNSLAETVTNCDTDEEVELFSGAPLRGHVPLITEMILTSEQATHPVVIKLDISKMQWTNWTDQIENRIDEIKEEIEAEENPYTLWNCLNEIITQATDMFCTTKKSSIHSKPYWNENLSNLSYKLRVARKNFIYRNTESNLDKYKEAKILFDEARKEACQTFIINNAKQLNACQAQQFWVKFNKLFKKKGKQKVDPLMNNEGDLLTEEVELDQCLFSVFFEAKHLINENFDDAFYREVNNMYDEIMSKELIENEQPIHIKNLNRSISYEELKKAIRVSGKSVDNYNFHPLMMKHLGSKALTLLQKLFNLCLSQHIWIWNSAEVIFLRKPGKSTYSKPGSYRPICITAYIGKLLEGIIAIRIESLLLQTNQTDPHQEGFSARRNTIRYLSKLNLDILADKENNHTTLGLFVDFEKAFDSVWKKGLMFKLYKLGIRGNIAKLINNFLFTREVRLNINGHIGENRLSSEYGLPQGSVISPVLFKIFIKDFVSELLEFPNIAILKFADDGTIKISAPNSTTCIETMNHVLHVLNNWSRKWRLNINCDKDKTEIICFNSAEGDKSNIPSSFNLGNKVIRRVTETKVLGVVIDEDLSYKSHTNKLLKDLMGRWANICNYSNRHWGFNTYVMLLLMKALFLSKISYADHVWMTKDNIYEICQLLYRMKKAITGAVLNIKESIAELILGIPPLQLQTKIHSIKHFLKINSTPVQNDSYKQFLHDTYDHVSKKPKAIFLKYKDTFEFLEWKAKLYPQHFNMEDQLIVSNKEFDKFTTLSSKACSYNQHMMKLYTESLWSTSMKYQFQLEGYPTSPLINCDPIPIPPNTPRQTEVQVTSLFYKNNTLNQCLYNLSKAASPMCPYCEAEEETSSHLIFRCQFVDESLRLNAKAAYRSALKLEETEEEPEDYIGLLSASKNVNFIKSCIEIVHCLNIKVLIDF